MPERVAPNDVRPLTAQLPDGRTAFYQRRLDDCMAAAVATLLQVHITDVPSPTLDGRVAAGEDPAAVDGQAWIELAEYVAGFGLELVEQTDPPVDRDGWLGICAAPGGESARRHVVVMAYDRVAFDPAANWPCPPGKRVAPVTRVSGGITLDPPVGERG